MKKTIAALALLSSVAGSISLGSVIASDQFNYTAGASLATASGGTWTSTAPTKDITIANDAVFNSTAASLLMANGTADRISTGSTAIATGNLFYSLYLDVTNPKATVTSGGFIAGFNNSAGTATASIAQAGARLQLAPIAANSTTTSYNLGIRNDNAAANGTSPIVMDTTDSLAPNTSVFVVVEYSFNQTNATDDVASLWVNPSSSTYGASTPPTTSYTSTGGDISQLQIQSFFLRENSSAATGANIDNVTIGTTWADVTPAPEPASLSLLGLGAIAGMARRRRTA